jgi:histidinol phosphatase-like enzyme (inositol monophosphatase family)
MPPAEQREIDRRLRVAITIATEAARGTLRPFYTGKTKSKAKADGTPVTQADQEAERYLRHAIAEAFPKDGVLGEEYGETKGTSGFRWIVDPIDGTQSFTRGVPIYGTLVAVEHERDACIGVIVAPALDEYVYASKGGGAWWVARGGRPKRTRVSKTARLQEALLCITSVSGFAQVHRDEAFARVHAAVQRIRGWGDCYGYLLVATGRCDAMMDPEMSLWDNAALKPVIEEAGGKFTDWTGKATIYGKDAVATNGKLHPALLKLLRA